MKVGVAAFAIALLTGCMSVTTTEAHLQKFLTTIPATGVSEVKQISICPFWIETAYAREIATHPDGRLHIAEARITLLSWFLFAKVSVKNFQQPPVKTPRASDTPSPSEQLRVRRERDPLNAK